MTSAEDWASSPRAACAMKINGVYPETLVPAYRALEVTGRHDFENEIETHDISAGGSAFDRARIKSRTLSVRFAIRTETTADLHAALEKLAAMLKEAEQAQIIFDDEPSVFYVATTAKMKLSTFKPTAATGEIEFFCADPYKYSVTVISGDAEDGVMEIDYRGTVPAAPILVAYAETDVGGYAFVKEENGATIKVGALEQADGEEVKIPETIIDSNFALRTGISDWTQGAQTALPTRTSGGTYDIAGRNYIDDEGLGAEYGSGANWHGPTYQLSIPEDSHGDAGMVSFKMTLNFDFASRSSSGNDRGRLRILFDAIDSGGFTQKIQVEIHKTDRSSYNAAIRVYVDGVELGAMTTAINDGQLVGATITLAKVGDALTLVTPIGSRTYRVPTIENAQIELIEIVMAQHGTNEPTTNCVKRFIVEKYDVTSWRDLPNTFTAGDMCSLDCSDSSIKINGVARPEMGDIANDWEGMRLVPGINRITCVTNDWVTTDPTFTYRYRRVYL